MNRLKNILTFLLLNLTIISCGQRKTKQQVDKIEKQKQVVQKYTTVISEPTNLLTNKIENLEIEYTVWGCACPNWVQTKDNIDADTMKSFSKFHFYIEPVSLPKNSTV